MAVKPVVINIGKSVSLPLFALWLFTLGYCHLDGKEALWAIFLWPYYIGAQLHGG